MKETESSKNKAENKSRNDSVKNMLQKNNLSFVHQEENDKSKVDFVAMNKSAVKKNNYRTAIISGKFPKPISKSERDLSFKSNTSTAKKTNTSALPNGNELIDANSRHSTLTFKSKKAKTLLNADIDNDLQNMRMANTPEWALSKISKGDDGGIVKDDVLKIYDDASK